MNVFPGSYSSDGDPRISAAADGERRYGPAYELLTSDRMSSVYGDSSGGPITPASALTLAAYYAAINVLSTDLACLPLKVYKRRRSGGRDEVTDDPRSDLLAVSPDGETTSMRWRQALIGHTLGHGNGYTEIEFAGGEVSGLKLLEPTTKPDRRSQDNRLYYRLPDDSTRPPYKLLHLAGLGYDGLCGYSVAHMARQTIKLGLSAEGFGAAFFLNGTNANGHFTSPLKMSDQAKENFRRSVNERHRGTGNAFNFMILEQGMTWTQTTIPPEDAQFLATREFQVVEIARLFRLPPHKLGDYSQSHLANIEQSNIDYMTTTLMPWCESVEQELNRKLFTTQERRDGYYVEHQMQAFLRGDMNSRATFYERMFGLGVMTPNDIAQRENMNPIGSDGDERFLSVQVQPFATVLAPQAPSPLPTGPAPARSFALNGSQDHG